MFDQLIDQVGDGLNKAWASIRIDGKLTESNIKEPMKAIRRALLEADVSLAVVKRLIKEIETNSIGTQVYKDAKPEQQLIKVVYDALRNLMGLDRVGLNEPEIKQPKVIMMVGLQGTGKTTACAKLALQVKNEQKGAQVMLVAGDIQRAAAVQQLGLLASKVDAQMYSQQNESNVVDIVQQGVKQGKNQKLDAIIVDTAGRLQIDDNLMNELTQIKQLIKPTDVLLVVDSMTGQEAGNLAQTFNERVGITGIILTKADGDSRGGAALSVKEVSGKPIKFVSEGESLKQLEPFYPDRMAKRILGQGDVLSLMEQMERNINMDESERMKQRLLQNKFDLNDFLGQYKLMSGMGSMGQIMKMVPGFNKVSDKQMEQAERQMASFKSMIDVMEEEEKSQPELLVKEASRIRRVARDADCTEQEVREMLAKFAALREQMKTYSKMMQASQGQGDNQMSDQEMAQALLQSSGGSIKPGYGRKVKKGKEQVAKEFRAKNKGFGQVPITKQVSKKELDKIEMQEKQKIEAS